MYALLLSSLFSAAAIAAPTIKTVELPVNGSAEHVALNCVAPAQRTDKALLFVHGATFPTRLAFGFEFSPGDSWLHFVAKQGYLACGVDFRGFGTSSRPAPMRAAAGAAAPQERANDAADDIAAAMQYLRTKQNITAIHLVAHSWGTIPAATYASRRPPGLKSLTLFGPVVPDGSPGPHEEVKGAWFFLTAPQRLEGLRFKSVLPPGKVLLEPQMETRWAAEFAASAVHEAGDAPGQMRIPNGPNADIADAEAGRYPYEQKAIDVPLFVVYGNYDTVVNDAQASQFLAKFTGTAFKWRLRIDDGTHVMHLEHQRRSLYESVAAFVRTVSERQP
ncbi:MAG: alpha/beta fold hydrolase [Rudaea sp.]|uniref:alpha/beta fold hydrolase n=1 Tax=unclassified Rudaea TaxID=2627037 RepID=UPI0010F7076D|nr:MULTISPECIES: alpha/beta fold hydrolase [unclassified Rudaea]MBN8887973.1 alpha/beta fold hydrolase [Rudaea sp.]